MIQILLYFILTLILILVACRRGWPSTRVQQLFNKLPRNKFNGLPYFGIALHVMLQDDNALFHELSRYITDKGYGAASLIGVPYVIVSDADFLEVLLSSKDYISKGELYETVKEWFGQGLLTSTGLKWHQDRKMLTPAFHFKVLEDNAISFNKHAKILISKLKETGGKFVETNNILKNCILDTICETVMGVSLNSQNHENQEYVNCVKEAATTIMKTELNFLYKLKLFRLFSPVGWRLNKLLKQLHNYTDEVIRQRKDYYMKKKNDLTTNDEGEKKRKAFLDILIETEMNNKGSFTPQDMREQVDTFMFEAHDTTTVILDHAVYCFGLYKDIQDKARAEVKAVFGDDLDKDLELSDVNRLTYLDKVIKEVLRLYPSVPAITRVLEKDMTLKDGNIVPATTNVILLPFLLHRNPKYFKHPEIFDPERFSDKVQRHPFSYIPFSAGPRNCIGQKFAMNELKIILSHILLNFEIESIEKDMKYAPYLILRGSKPIEAKFTPIY